VITIAATLTEWARTRQLTEEGGVPSVAQVAKTLGVAWWTAKRWLDGTSKPRARDLAGIAIATGLDLDLLKSRAESERVGLPSAAAAEEAEAVPAQPAPPLAFDAGDAEPADGGGMRA
jgi:hypothetical protein